ncbi:hypothetical protein [Couchioplanes caeruleus]|uniref:Uncharacterized protein n=2 Tax=Couchioplanes caeruleus TaxID=56438 RepID=A0A1K0FJV5_9ACTN|nr:hypothetical protein [Couchioplanes caeruleus]OJF13133.1 hypothetical protein BG844_16805 [Couchioplanes caeruleus subsp. caeruleus]ROP28106.1 hypothetical protein EDD30_0815 [Couchioplanes caeruleus]
MTGFHSDLTVDKLILHAGHEVEIVTYAGENVSLDCMTCGETLTDAAIADDAEPADRPGTPVAVRQRRAPDSPQKTP